MDWKAEMSRSGGTLRFRMRLFGPATWSSPTVSTQPGIIPVLISALLSPFSIFSSLSYNTLQLLLQHTTTPTAYTMCQRQ